MAQRATSDAILDLLGMGSGEADAAGFPEVVKLLQKLGPAAWKALDPKSKRALELMTESYPALKKGSVSQIPFGVGSGHWPPPGKYSVKDWTEGLLTHTDPLFDKEIRTLGKPVINRFGSQASPYGFSGIDAFDIGSARGRSSWVSPQHQNTTPTTAADIYAHEVPGHAFHGNLQQWSGGGKDYNFWGNPTALKGAKEGFSEGMGNALLGKYNFDTSHWYWPNQFRQAAPYPKESFVKSGFLGRDAGRAAREGEVIPQQQIIELLLDIINRYK